MAHKQQSSIHDAVSSSTSVCTKPAHICCFECRKARSTAASLMTSRFRLITRWALTRHDQPPCKHSSKRMCMLAQLNTQRLGPRCQRSRPGLASRSLASKLPEHHIQPRQPQVQGCLASMACHLHILVISNSLPSACIWRLLHLRNSTAFRLLCHSPARSASPGYAQVCCCASELQHSSLV